MEKAGIVGCMIYVWTFLFWDNGLCIAILFQFYISGKELSFSMIDGYTEQSIPILIYFKMHILFSSYILLASICIFSITSAVLYLK